MRLLRIQLSYSTLLNGLVFPHNRLQLRFRMFIPLPRKLVYSKLWNEIGLAIKQIIPETYIITESEWLGNRFNCLWQGDRKYKVQMGYVRWHGCTKNTPLKALLLTVSIAVVKYTYISIVNRSIWLEFYVGNENGIGSNHIKI